MDAFKEVADDMRSCIGKALKQGILINPRTSGDFYNNPVCISSKYTMFTHLDDYLQNYHHTYEKGEYLAAFLDGSFLQVNYEFEKSGKKHSYLKKMNLCYLPVVEYNNTKNEYIRVDYDSTSPNSFFHPIAHVHIGFSNTIRLPIDEVFLFSEFLKWILYLYYPKEFVTYSNNSMATGNTINTKVNGRITKSKVLSSELEAYFYLKTFDQ